MKKAGVGSQPLGGNHPDLVSKSSLNYQSTPLLVKPPRACLAKVRRTGVYLSPDGQARLPSQGGKPQGGLGTLPAPGPGGGPSHPQRQAGPPLALQPRPLPGPPSLPRFLPPHLPRDGGLTPGPDGRPLPFPPVPGPLRPQAPGPQTP